MELAERHGWTGDPAAGIACMAVAAVLVWQGQPDEAEPWVQRAERTLTADTQPAAVLTIRYIRGTLELERGRNAAALAALEAGEALARRLAGPNYFAARIRATLVHALIRLGQVERAGQFLAGLGEQDRERGELRVAAAELRLAQGDPQAALAALAPIQQDPVPRTTGDSGGPGRTCWRRSSGTRSATPMPLMPPWSAPWTCPSAAAT